MGTDRKGPLAAFVLIAIVAAVLLVTSVRSQAAPGWLKASTLPAALVADPPATDPHLWVSVSSGLHQAVRDGVSLLHKSTTESPGDAVVLALPPQPSNSTLSDPSAGNGEPVHQVAPPVRHGAHQHHTATPGQKHHGTRHDGQSKPGHQSDHQSDHPSEPQPSEPSGSPSHQLAHELHHLQQQLNHQLHQPHQPQPHHQPSHQPHHQPHHQQGPHVTLPTVGHGLHLGWSHGQGHTANQGHGHGKGHGKGHGQGHGHGHGHSQGHSHGHGKGHGQSHGHGH